MSVPTRGGVDTAIQRVGGSSGSGWLSWPVADHCGSIASTVRSADRSNQRTGASIRLQ